MFSWIRRRITYANAAMTLALVFAMSGGAYAAKHYLITSTKQIKPSVLAQLKGKDGTNGKDGAQGPAGPQGPAGEKGANGTNGKDGAEGPIGATGPAGANGENGATGLQGPQGEPWVPNNTLPAKATEKGSWAIYGTAAAANDIFAYAFSFPIPLAANVAEANIGLSFEGAPIEHCPGGVEKPEAEPGFFCIFIGTKENALPASFKNVEGNKFNEAGKTGLVMEAASNAIGPVRMSGSWAVTEK